MYDSEDDYSFVVLSRANSFKKVRAFLAVLTCVCLGKTRNYCGFIGCQHESFACFRATCGGCIAGNQILF